MELKWPKSVVSTKDKNELEPISSIQDLNPKMEKLTNYGISLMLSSVHNRLRSMGVQNLYNSCIGKNYLIS